MIKKTHPFFAADGAAVGGAAPKGNADAQAAAPNETGKAAEAAKPSFDDLLKDETYKSAFDKAMADAQAALKREQEEAAKQESMNPDEKLQAALDKAEKLEKENAAILLKNKTAALLGEKKLPAEFVDFLVGADEKVTAARVDMFEKTYSAAVAAAAKDLVPGYTPKTGSKTDSDGWNPASNDIVPGRTLNPTFKI